MPPRNLCRVLVLLLTYPVVFGAVKDIERIWTKNLSDPGYYAITTIPKGATAIYVIDLAEQGNFLAVRLDNNTYLFNGKYTINKSEKYKGAGTFFVYTRHNERIAEKFYSPGPLDSPVDVMLIYNGILPKVKYQYKIPDNLKSETTTQRNFAEITPSNLQSPSTAHFLSTILPNVIPDDNEQSSTPIPRIKRRRKFTWKAAGFSKCSKSCGGGYRTKKYVCVRRRGDEPRRISDKKCLNAKNLQKPNNVTLPCNSQPCPPRWETGKWNKCSTTCGNGIRTRQLLCVQEMSDKLSTNLDAKYCPAKRPTTITMKEVCHMPSCEVHMTTPKPSLTTRQYIGSIPHWKVEKWSSCSVTCGRGRRTRVVTCITAYGKVCNMVDKPASEEPCNVDSCISIAQIENEIPEALVDSPWLYSAWPKECSSECERGTLTRRLYCESFLRNKTCSLDNMPPMNKTCVSSHNCGQWFSGPWTKCSSSCDTGIATRETVCVYRLLGVLKIVDPVNCSREKPETMRSCTGPPCNATWFTSDWTQCSLSCGTGTQKREVKCIRPDGMPINASELECDGEKRPPSERSCNDAPCEKLNTEETNAIANMENQ
ncbi:thrombospondin type-1 domain-containing protein 4-like [Phymastichus coffea]|uniref:thrombospondin type-1 domain-containing protein 4-like n=1 Tax=Phymastichus coffea TaxID=108790 RepID=UPI00273AF31E|nr:thrombospondin type-1 domain-containing protein 4-like [Phymastichus coffea]